MPVNGINHVNIRTTDVAASRSSMWMYSISNFARVSGHGPAAELAVRQERARPIIHLRIMEADSDSTGPIDHVALDCEGLSSVIERLKARHIEFNVANVQAGVTLVLRQGSARRRCSS
jgi:hypothetical protein